MDVLYDFIELPGQNDVLTINGMIEQRSDFINPETGDATAYFSDQELQFRMLFGKSNKLIHVRLDSLNAALHRGNGITLTLQSDTLAPYRSKPLIGQSCRTTAMCSGEIAAKDEYLILFQLRYSFGGYILCCT